MTEDQILQRVAESQKRVFSDIDSSKQGNASQGFQIVGANGLNVQQQGNQIAISGDSSALQGARGERGEEGPQGLEGPQGIQGVAGQDGGEGPEGPEGSEGPRGPEGPEGPKGDTGNEGPQGVGIVSAAVSQNLSFTFTLTDGSTITTNALIGGDGVLAVEGGALTVLQTQSCN